MADYDVTQIEQLLYEQHLEALERMRKAKLEKVLLTLRQSPSTVNAPTGLSLELLPASKSEFQEVEDLHTESGGINDGFQSDTQGNLYKFHETMRSTIFLARENKTRSLVGVACIDWSADILKTALVTNLLVLPTFRRHGVAQSLMGFIEKTVLQFGHHQVAVMVMPSNADAQSLYQKMGYTRIFDGVVWTRCPFPLDPSKNANVPDPLLVFAKMLDGEQDYN
ncbi:MAG: GNAT family N-acetyltransferase [Cyanobacteria bacterium SZAS TMP-1]|nr:GNAT family N-acetyltransferase [Cyanobacteria bacterium SZAS TMP-1]